MQITFYINGYVLWSLILLFLIAAFAEKAEGQAFIFRNYGIEDGLPSTEVHDISQGPEGYMWFATDHGLCRFDGFEFKVFSTSDGLTDNTIFDVIHQPDSSLMLTTYTGGLSYFKDGKGSPIPHNEKIKDFLGDYYISHIIPEADNEFTFRYMLSGRPIGAVGKLTAGGEILVDTSIVDSLFTIPMVPKGEEKVFIDTLNQALDSKRLVLEEGCQILRGSAGHTFWMATTVLMGYNPINNQIDTLQNYRTFAMIEDHRGNFWISAGEGRGFNLIRLEDKFWEKTENYLVGKTVSDIFEDREGNIWISTVENGIYFLSNPGVKILDPALGLNVKLLSLEVWGDRLWAGGQTGLVYSIDENYRVDFWESCNSNAGFFDLASSNEYLLTATKCLLSQDKTHQLQLFRFNPKAVAIDEFNIMYLGGVLGLAKFNITGKALDEEMSLSDSISVYSLFIDSQNTLWIGTIYGLWRYKDDQLENLSHLDPKFKIRITDIKELRKDELLIATKGEGLLFYYPDTIFQISTDQGLNSQFVKSIYVENENTIWVGGNQGVNRITLFPGDRIGIKSIESFSTSNGLPSNEVYEIEMFNGELCLATGAGLCRVDLSFFEQKPVAPKLIMTRLMVDKSAQEIKQNLVLKPGNNDIDFEYVGFFFRESDGITYQYLLQGYDEEWQSTNLRKASYTNLPSGEYSFLLRASNPSGIWTDDKVMLSFEIQKPYFEKWWFRSLVLLFGALLLSGIFLIIIWRQRKQAAIERKVIQSEQTALRAQINPHFIFNAMNSINYFITENDKHNAGIYLSRFSKLMRGILDNSKKNWVSLEEELNALRNYLELEQMRFSEKFDYEIELSPKIDLYETEVPSMIIQPFLENAIWHGFMRKKEKGLLRLSFSGDGGFVNCVIEDNGIGRTAAAKHRRRGHKSTGLNNVMERIQLINAQYHTKMHASLEDLSDENDRPTGTRVLIRFPKSK